MKSYRDKYRACFKTNINLQKSCLSILFYILEKLAVVYSTSALSFHLNRDSSEILLNRRAFEIGEMENGNANDDADGVV